MAVQMTDPMNALTSFQEALRKREINPQQGDLHSDLLVLMDQPQGVSRFTYALTENGKAIAVAIFVIADPINGATCFNAGYAVDPSFRSRGLGKLVVQKAFDELTNGFRRAKIPHLHVEAIVSTSNEPSKKLARRLFSSTPT